MHVAAMVLSDPFGCQVVDMLCIASAPLRLDFWTAIERCMTKVGALHRDIGLSTGKYEQVLTKTVQTWGDIEALKAVGFLVAGSTIDDPEEHMSIERRLCAHWFVWLRRIIDSRLGSVGTWTSTYPHHFVGLVSDDIEVQRASLADAKHDFELLESLEQLAYDNLFARNFVKELMWPNDTFVRETFIDLVEAEWKLPLHGGLQARLKGFAFANKRTKIQEDLFKACRKRQSLSDAGFCSRRGRWDIAIRSSLIREYDRKPLNISPQAKDVAGKSLGAAMFENKAASKFSMGADVLDSLHEDPASWPSPSPMSYKVRVTAWSCMQHFQGDVAKVQLSWLSLLAMPGYMLYHSTLLPHGSLSEHTTTHIQHTEGLELHEFSPLRLSVVCRVLPSQVRWCVEFLASVSVCGGWLCSASQAERRSLEPLTSSPTATGSFRLQPSRASRC
jgi:hypothetical protein